MRSAGEDILIEAGTLGPAVEGDDVEVAIVRRSERDTRGRVLRVLSRMPRRLCGIVDAGLWFIPDDPRHARPLRCTGYVPRPEEGGTLCGAELLSEVDGNAPEVRIERCFGDRGSPLAEEEAVLWRERMDAVFPPAALAEAEQCARSAYENADPRRLDWRAIDFITIAPETAEAHDDALFAKRLPDGSIRVFVAIADVGAFVPAGSALDLEARRRSASLSLPGRVIPMLPPILSSDAASLLPHQERAAVVLEARLEPEGRVLSHRVVLALIRSRAKLTYEEAREVLESGGASGTEMAGTHAETLLLFDDVARRLRARRRERAAIAVAPPELLMDTDPTTGLPLGIRRPTHDPWLVRAHQLVEELMLLANEMITGMLRERLAKALYRVQSAPYGARALRLMELARRHEIALDVSVALDPLLLRGLLRAISDRTQRDEASALVFEAMPSRLNAAHRQDHIALASRHHLQFTSPLRRYSDLMIQRAIRAVITGDNNDPDESDLEEATRARHRARAIQRELADLYAALLMRGREGGTHHGTILCAMNRYWIIALDDPAICVRCVRPGLPLDEGARITVRIERVSIAGRTITAAFVAALAG